MLKVPQNITSVELPWSMRTLCTLMPTVTTEITMGLSLYGTKSLKLALGKQRSGSSYSSCSRASTVITSLAYLLCWEAVPPPPEKPPEIVLISSWTGTSCLCSTNWSSSFVPSGPPLLRTTCVQNSFQYVSMSNFYLFHMFYSLCENIIITCNMCFWFKTSFFFQNKNSTDCFLETIDYFVSDKLCTNLFLFSISDLCFC